MPAALTSESKPSSVWTAEDTPSITESSLPTFIATVVSRSATAASSARARVLPKPSTATSAATMVAPSSSSRSAVAWPIPDAAPVTRIRLPSSRFIFFSRQSACPSDILHQAVCGIVDAMEIGFIGLGDMGRAVATNLMDAGSASTAGSDHPTQPVGAEHGFQHCGVVRAASQYEPTVDVDHLPSDVAGRIAEQKHRQVGDVLDLTGPRQRRAERVVRAQLRRINHRRN